MSTLVGKWANPEGGEMVEFTAEGTMVVSRGGEVLATQRYATRNNGAEGGDLLLRADWAAADTDGAAAEVALEYRIDSDTLVMGFSGETSIYARASE